jgi:hypothetical protein
MEPTLPNINGSSRFSSVVGDVKNVVSDVANLMKSAVRDSTTLVNNLSNAVGNFKGSSRSGGSASTVFNQPTPSPGSGMGEDNTGGGRGGVKQLFNQPGFGEKAAALASIGMQALPGANAQVQQNYLATYAGAYGYGNGNLAARYDQAQQLQARMFGAGTGLNTLDASRAMATGQARGIGVGLSNYNNLAMGVAGMSNFTPGVGLEGTMSAYASLQRPSNVNMMRMIGITARDPLTGQMKSYTEIANQLWNKINAEKSVSRAITKNDLATSLQPGNSLAIMLDAVAGNDGVLRSQLEAALYSKVSGAKNYSREEAARTGFTTRALDSQANRTAQSFNTLAQTSRAGALGVETSNDLASVMSVLVNSIDALTGVLKVGSAGGNAITGFSMTGNGAIGQILGALGLKNIIPGLATGGAAQGSKAYVVGEKGPELFVPDQNGTVVPNHKLQFGGFREKGGAVEGFASSLITGLGGQVTPDAIDAITTWMRYEGGGGGPSTGIGKNKAKFNPLNTTLNAPGATSINKVGVKAYTSMEQGLQSTISTLTGSNADKRGYTNIIKALQSGASKTEIMSAITNSAWVSGKTGQDAYNWFGAKNTTDQGGGSGVGGLTGQTYMDMIKAANPQAAAMAWGASGGSTNNNYGGVTIIIQADKNPNETAKQIKEVLKADQIARKAARS